MNVDDKDITELYNRSKYETHMELENLKMLA